MMSRPLVFFLAVLAASPAHAARVELVPDAVVPAAPGAGAASAAPIPLALFLAPLAASAPIGATPVSLSLPAVAASAPLPASAALAPGRAAEIPAARRDGSRPTSPEIIAAPLPNISNLSGAESVESQALEQSVRFDRSRAASPSQAVAAGELSDAALADAYENGTLAAAGASAQTSRLLTRAADQAVREKLGAAHFKVFYLYGGILGTKMYEAPELPGVILKAYAAPFGWRGKAWRGYSLAKERLGGLFAETTIVEGIEILIEGKKRRLPWALVQEKVKVEEIADFGKRSYKVLLGMLKRGVRDNDRRRPGIDPIDAARNLGEAPDGRFVHFDADFFAAEKSAEEGPKRVRDPPVLREAIREAQLDALRRERP